MFIDLLRQRRSVRKFLDRPVEKEKIDLLIEGVLRAPSSKGINPWEFIVISDTDRLKQLSAAKIHGSAFLKNAPLALVVCADTSKTDAWIEDTSIASIIAHFLAADLGLGSCWVQIRMRDYDKQISSQDYLEKVLGLENNIAVEAIIGIGYSAEGRLGHPESSLLYERVHLEKFGNPM